MSDTTDAPVAVITGASSGIGAATARALAGHGYRLALLARRTDRLEQLADELGGPTLAIAADVTDRDAVLAAADRVRIELGGADVLVNNAGVMLLGPFGSEQRDEALEALTGNAALVLDDLDKARPTEYAARAPVASSWVMTCSIVSAPTMRLDV